LSRSREGSVPVLRAAFMQAFNTNAVRAGIPRVSAACAASPATPDCDYAQCIRPAFRILVAAAIAGAGGANRIPRSFRFLDPGAQGEKRARAGSHHPKARHRATDMRANVDALAVRMFRPGVRRKGFMPKGQPIHSRAPRGIGQMPSAAIPRHRNIKPA